MTAGGTTYLPAWTGTPATPTTWAAGTPGYFGLTVLAATGGKDAARWGTGTTATSFATLRYAGLLSTTPTQLRVKATAAAPDTVEVAFRVNPSAAQAPGSYSTVITYTAVANL